MFNNKNNQQGSEVNLLDLSARLSLPTSAGFSLGEPMTNEMLRGAEILAEKLKAFVHPLELSSVERHNFYANFLTSIVDIELENLRSSVGMAASINTN